jgi:hypothetical protein
MPSGVTETPGRFTDDIGRRSPVPLVVLLVGLLIAGATIVSLGSRGDVDDEAAPDFPNTEDIHLGPEDQLLVAGAVIDGSWTVTWDRVRPPATTTGAIGLIPAPGTPEAAGRSLDAGGSVLAGEVCRRVECAVVLTTADDPLARVTTFEADSFIWHANDPLRIAWIARDPNGPILRSGVVDTTTASVIEISHHGTVSGRDRLIRWDDHGFILSGSGVRAIGPDGALLWYEDAALLDTSAGLVTVSHPSGAWSIIDRTTGRPIMRSVHGARAIVVADVDNATSSVSPDGYRYTLTVPTGAPGTRILSIGSDPGTAYRVYRNDDGSKITFRVERPVSAIAESPIG